MSGVPFAIPEPLAQRLDRLGLEFLEGCLGAELARHPDNLAALAERAEVLTRLGRVEEGLALDRELCRRAPDDPTAHYNLACSLALCGAREEALDALERAAGLGYDDPAHLLADEDLASLRDAPRFRALLAALRG